MQGKIQITNRDLHILREISLSRFLTVAHIAQLCFEGRLEAAKKRILKLVASGYLESKEIFPGIPQLKFLSRLGSQSLGNSAAAPPALKLQIANLKHELLLRDCMCAGVAAARKFSFQAEIQLQPHLLKIQEWTNTRHLAPDGIWKLNVNGTEFLIFVELDCGTEKQKELSEKFRFYRDFLSSKHNSNQALGVLFIFTQKKRMERFDSRCQREKQGPLVTPVVLETFLANPLGALGIPVN